MMAIAAISAASTSTAASIALPGSAPADSSAGGFADLLFSQLGIPAGEFVRQAAAGNAAEAARPSHETLPEQGAPATDPALAFLIAAPLARAPSAPGTPEIPDPALAATPAASPAKDRRPAGDNATAPPNAGIPDPGASLSQEILSAVASGTVSKTPADPSDPATTPAPFIDPSLGALPMAPAIAPPAVANPGIPPASPRPGERAKSVGNEALPSAAPATADQAPVIPQEGKGNSAFQNVLATTGNFSPASKGNDSLNMAANIAAEPPAAAAGTAPEAGPVTAGAAPLNHSARTEPPLPARTEIATPLHASAWSHDFGDKLVWLARNNQQVAQININPPQLGPIQITLQISGDQATAAFASPHAEVRQVIENSLPQLKEMLSGAGINLGQADVGANLAQQHRETPFQEANRNRLPGENAILPCIGNEADSTVSSPIHRGRGLVDLFA